MVLKKRLGKVVLCAVLAVFMFVLSSCQGLMEAAERMQGGGVYDENSYRGGFAEIDKTSYRYNGFLGLKVKLTEGYSIIESDLANLSETPGVPATLEEMNSYKADNARQSYSFIGMQNMADATDERHAGMFLIMDFYMPQLAYDSYYDYILDFALQETPAMSYELIDKGTQALHDGIYETITVHAFDKDSGAMATEKYFMKKVDYAAGELYFVIYTKYCEDNEISVESARYLVEDCVEFAKAESVQI